MSEPTRPDVSEMTAVHRVFRHTFASAPQVLGTVADGDTERADLVGSFYGDVLEFLRVHHEGEDDLMFPKLVARAEDPDAITRIAEQHHAVDGALSAAKTSVAAFRASGSANAGTQVAADIAALESVVVAHLDAEERDVLPVVERHITLAEWDEMPGHAMQSFQGDDLFLIVGLVSDQFNDVQNERMLEGMPPPVADAWRTVGLDAYKAKVGQIGV